MKIISSIFGLLLVFIFAFIASAEPWHTASGKSYNVYVISRPPGKEGGRFYYLSYQTTHALNDKIALESEFYDLLTHLYYLKLTEQARNEKNAVIAIEAFKEFPKSAKDKKPSMRYAKKLPEVETIVKNHKGTDWDRLRALQDLKGKKYKTAITFFEKIKNKVPHDFLRIANTHIFLKNKKEAIRAFEAGINKYPENSVLLNNFAMAIILDENALAKGAFRYDPAMKEKALEILARAQKADSKNWRTSYNMSLVESAAQNPNAAEKHLKKALKLSGENIDLHYRLATFYHQQKNFSKAKKEYGKAIKKLKPLRSPAAKRRIKFLEDRLKLAKEKKLP